MNQILKKSLMLGGFVAILSIIYNLIRGFTDYIALPIEAIIAGVVINFVIFMAAGFLIFTLFNKNKLNILLSNIFLVIAAFITIWIAPNGIVPNIEPLVFSYSVLGKLFIANIAFMLVYFLGE